MTRKTCQKALQRTAWTQDLEDLIQLHKNNANVTVCMYVSDLRGCRLPHNFSLSWRQPSPPQGIISTQTEAIIRLPPICPMTTWGVPWGNYPLPFPAKSRRLRTRLIYCDTRWLMVQAIKDRSQEKPRCSGNRPISQASSGQDADKTDRTLSVG